MTMSGAATTPPGGHSRRRRPACRHVACGMRGGRLLRSALIRDPGEENRDAWQRSSRWIGQILARLRHRGAPALLVDYRSDLLQHTHRVFSPPISYAPPPDRPRHEGTHCSPARHGLPLLSQTKDGQPHLLRLPAPPLCLTPLHPARNVTGRARCARNVPRPTEGTNASTTRRKGLAGPSYSRPRSPSSKHVSGSSKPSNHR